MAKISSAFQAQLEGDPNAVVQVIARVEDNPKAYTRQIETRGITVKRIFTLISGFALSGPAAAILALSKESWVVSIEPDKSVHTMG